MNSNRVLIGSPIRQKPQILAEFLSGLKEADKDGLEVSFCFVDDNTNPDSSKLLTEFAGEYDAEILSSNFLLSQSDHSQQLHSKILHDWDLTTIRKVAYLKDCIIEYAIDHEYDFLFLVDSDIVIDHRTLRHLVSRDVEIISNVFWTQWQLNWEIEPQCFWIPDIGCQSKTPFSPLMQRSEARQIKRNFFAQMRVPGIYRVDGLGACTLISLSALKKGVRFKEIPNLSQLGEDRDFCIRAGVLGIDLYFDTVYPVYHIYREQYLDRVDEFKRDGFKFDMCQTFTREDSVPGTRGAEIKRIVNEAVTYLKNRTVGRIQRKMNPPLVFHRKAENQLIAVQMLVESFEHFEESLNGILELSKHIVIMDMSGKVPENEAYTVIRANTADYRLLWEKSAESKPDWILSLRSNEVFCQPESIPYLIRNTGVDCFRFRTTDIIGEQETDAGYLPYLTRFEAGYAYSWKNDRDFPDEVFSERYADLELNVSRYHKQTESDTK